MAKLLFQQIDWSLQLHDYLKVVIAERFQFFRRQQDVGETVAEYEAELRKLATHCDYGAFLEQALRDRLVCGLRNEASQKHLLSKANLTLEKALEIAQGMEAADSNTHTERTLQPLLKCRKQKE